MRTVAFCEREPAPRHWLSQHWPGVPIFDDVRTLTAESLRGLGRIDLIAGGFPCQPFSVAGKQKGTEDERHLWPHFARLIRDIRPRWVLAENVPGLRTIAADLVLQGLEESGYTAWPLVVGADYVGAPHRRKRVWIVAHGDGAGLEKGLRSDAGEPQEPESRDSGLLGDAEGWDQWRDRTGSRGQQEPPRGSGSRWPSRPGEPQHAWEAPRLARTANHRRNGRAGSDTREPESGMGNAVDELPRRVARFRTSYTSAHRREALKALGNAVCPAVVEVIGRAIMLEHCKERAS